MVNFYLFPLSCSPTIVASLPKALQQQMSYSRKNSTSKSFRTLNGPINLPSCTFSTLDESEAPAAQLLMSHHSGWL
jgi:hypothetical protein